MALINCPECGEENIPDSTKFCPNCGYKLKKKKFSKNTIIVIIISILLVSAFFKIIYETKENNTFAIKQRLTNIELGNKCNLENLIEYDKNNIISVDITNDGGFDCNKIGTYSVTYTVTNNKNNKKSFVYTFEVKDTTKPHLTLEDEKAILFVGEDFLINEYASASDASGECEILFDEEINNQKAGTCTIGVYAKDVNGNISDKQEMKITYYDKRESDVRNVCFGDAPETVRRFEEVELDESEGALGGFTTINGCEYMLVYRFNNNDELCAVMLYHEQWHSNADYYITEYKKIIEELENKYGIYSDSNENRHPMASYCSTDGEAVMLGYLTKNTEWNLMNMNISVGLFGDSGNITLVVFYESTTIRQPSTQSNF